MPLSQREKQELDRYITGNWGEDQFDDDEDAGDATDVCDDCTDMYVIDKLVWCIDCCSAICKTCAIKHHAHHKLEDVV